MATARASVHQKEDQHLAGKTQSPCQRSRLISKNDDSKKAARQGYGGSRRSAGVRVVQIFNPVFVTTDVENFSSLVQKLTGCKSRRCRKNLEAVAARAQRSLEEKYAASPRRQLQLPDASPTPPDHSLQNPIFDQISTSSTETSFSCSGGSIARLNSCSIRARCFSELDIWAGLVSECPLPDLTMLPPLPMMHSASARGANSCAECHDLRLFSCTC